MQTIEIKNSIGKAVIWLVVCGAFFILGVVLAFNKDLRLAGFVQMGLWGLLSVPYIYRLLDKRPRIILDSLGVTDTKSKVGRVDWSDISSAKVYRVKNVPMIALSLQNPEKYHGKLSALARGFSKVDKAFGAGDLNLNVHGVEKSPEEISRLIMQNCERYRSESSSKYNSDNHILMSSQPSN